MSSTGGFGAFLDSQSKTEKRMRERDKNGVVFILEIAKDISPQSYKKAIRLRLIHTYTVTEGRNKSAVNSQECVFHDIEGTYVHASIHADFIDQFSHLLKEDVIGRVVEFYSPKDKAIAGFPTQLVDFLIEDSKGNRIKCTLWDEHVPAVMPFFNNHVDGHLIVLLQLCRAKIVDSEVRISSSYTATKVFFNLDCQEFADFRNSLKANCSPLRSISMVSYGHSANNSQSLMVVRTIRDLYERAEEGYYYVPETYYFCDTCKTNWAEGNVRYKVIVRVLDKTSDAPFVLWDKDCFELLGITAYDLKTKLRCRFQLSLNS
nr:replication factor A protein 1-like isoform X2 [Ipomoea batatas]